MDYAQQLIQKKERLTRLLAPFWSGEIAVFPSPEQHYRMRAEFRIWHQDGRCLYVMGKAGKPIGADNFYPIESFSAASEAINALMPRLLAHINCVPLLSRALFQVEFLTSLAGDALISLIYHKKLDEDWIQAARALKTLLGVDIVGRSRKQKIVLDRDYIYENFNVDGRDFRYMQIEQSFSQPNAHIAQTMLRWVCQNLPQSCQGRDLLELYCGNGNFTLPLSQHFRRVLATEVSKTSLRALAKNMAENRIENLAIARLSAEEFGQAWRGERAFRRLQMQGISLQDYNFSMVFVDPPRAGIDRETLAWLPDFAGIFYVSCNPETLAANLSALASSHQVQKVALFDQFPFTEHMESAVLLERRE